MNQLFLRAKVYLVNKCCMDDFEYQLQAQQGYARPAADPSVQGSTFVDPTDGTVYEWDHKQKGWVPKVSILINAHLSSLTGRTCTTR